MMNDVKTLKTIYDSILGQLFPQKYESAGNDVCSGNNIEVLEGIRKTLKEQEFSPVENITLLTDKELLGSNVKDEYARFCEFWDKSYIQEFLWIGREITPFNTLGHVCGVHYIAMHVAKQLKKAGFPIDLALISAAAACHDLGKYGCTGKEIERIPYLHYYYTQELLERLGMPQTGWIAGNHSVWDLERSNLSVEWMILIYADFRVKSERDENGKEHVVFSSLNSAFDVIMNKLDNLDEYKKQRYKRAYAKLKKFEDYMIYLGVDPEPGGSFTYRSRKRPVAKKYANLDYSLRAAGRMNPISREKKTEMLELLADRFGNMTDEVKPHVLMLMTEFLRHYDRVYNKELPEGIVIPEPEITAAELAAKYMEILNYEVQDK